MALQLTEAKAPAFLKLAFYGLAGSGKTYTAARMLSEFQKKYRPKSRIAMLDTEGGAGFVAPLVRQITGKELLAVAATSFGELKEFVQLCAAEHYIGIIDSATHIWRAVMEDYLSMKRTRAKNAGNVNPHNITLSLRDWGPIKEVWNAGFANPYKFLAADLCYCGRCGDNWEMVTNEDTGKKEMQATGTKMKIESESAYEPSLLIEMIRVPNPLYDPIQRPDESQWIHRAEVVKDRAALLTGRWADDPGMEFIEPHVRYLLNGEHAAPTDAPATFKIGEGMSWETMRKRREAVLGTIKDDLILRWPGQSDDAKRQKLLAIRAAFGENASWAALENDTALYPLSELEAGLERIRKMTDPPPKATEKKAEKKPEKKGKGK